MALPTTPRAEVRETPPTLRTRHVCDGSARKRVALRLLSVIAMRDHRGFTLIEVLVVTVLVGVLAGLAIAQYASYRSRGFDSKVAAAVRGVATSEEAYYAAHLNYAGTVAQLGTMAIGDVAITIAPGNTGSLDSSFSVLGTHRATTRSFSWISDPLPGQPNLIEN